MTMPATPTLVRKTVTVSDVKVLDAAQGIVEALVNSLEVVDFDGEVIIDGAFDRHMQRSGKLPKVAWFHQANVPVGKCLETRQVGTQQWVKAQFNLETQRGREAFSDVQFGAVDEWSVGFYVLEAEAVERDGKRRRGIKELDWVEFSPVMRGASPGTGTVSAKEREGEDPAMKALSFERTRDAVQNALQPPYVRGMAYEYWWILETYADHVIACQESDAGGTQYWKVPYTIAEDGTVTLGEKTEVERVYVPVGRVTAMRDGMASVIKHLSRLAQTPAPATADAAAGTEPPAPDPAETPVLVRDDLFTALQERALLTRLTVLPSL